MKLLTIMALALNQASDTNLSEGILVQSKSAQTETAKKIREAMKLPFSCDYKETHFTNVIDDFRAKLGATFILDTQERPELSETSLKRITLQASNISTGSALSLVLRPLQLGWSIQHEAVVIGDADRSDIRTVRVYPVLDLLDDYEDFEPLAEVLTRTVNPDSWSDAGGAAYMETYSPAGALIVYHWEEDHAMLADALSALRQARRIQGIRRPQRTIPPRVGPRFSRDSAAPRVFRTRAYRGNHD